MKPEATDAYSRAGVDVAAANALVSSFRDAARRATRPEVPGDAVGGFAGLFRWPGPAGAGRLVAGCDGVGTKVELARQFAALHPERAAEIYRNLGQDLVAMCVNDILCTGGRPLFFLDYLASGRLEANMAVPVVEGVARACAEVGAALLGGETAEMPGVYAEGAFDLAGFAVGWVDEALSERLRDGPRLGDAAIGLASSGPHSNGFSLVRNVLNDTVDGDATRLASLLDSIPTGFTESLGESLLRPTRLYVEPVLHALAELPIRGLAHITGGGLVDNPPRPLGPGLAVEIREGAWPEPPVFGWLAQSAGLSRKDMRRTFNLGLGMLVYVDERAAGDVVAWFDERGIGAFNVGRVESSVGDTWDGAPRVRFT